MKRFFLFSLCTLLFSGVHAFGQGAALRALAQGAVERAVPESLSKEIASQAANEGWRMYLSKNTLEGYMLMDEKILQEMYAGSSIIGGAEHVQYNKWRQRTDFLGDDLSKKITAFATKSKRDYAAFPAYYESFPKVWAKVEPVLHSLGVFEGA